MSCLESANRRVLPARWGRLGSMALFLVMVVGFHSTAFGQAATPTGQQPFKMISGGLAGGGGRSQGGSFALEGTIGQTVAKPMNGGSFLVQSGFIPMCPLDCDLGDIDCDDSVGGSDLGIILLLFGPCPDPFSCPGDLDNSGEIDGGDLGLVLLLWR